MANRKEYAVEVHNEDDFQYQIDLYPTLRGAKQCIKEYDEELDTGDYFVIKRIIYAEPDEYDDEAELDVEIVYSTEEI